MWYRFKLLQCSNKNFDAPYVIPEEFYCQFKEHISDGLSFLHINIRGINKNFENFNLFLSSLDFTFRVVCFSETWLDETTRTNKSLWITKLCRHSSREKAKFFLVGAGGGVSLYIHQSVEFKIRNDMSVTSDDVESISVETRNPTGCNNCYDLLHIGFTLKISIFSVAYI